MEFVSFVIAGQQHYVIVALPNALAEFDLFTKLISRRRRWRLKLKSLQQICYLLWCLRVPFRIP